MQVKIKKCIPSAVIPTYAKEGDAGMDLTTTSKVYDEFGNVSFGTGIAVEIPEGYVGLVFPRSSNCKKDLLLSNSVGVIDSNYRGEIILKFKPSLFFALDSPAPEGRLGEDSYEFDFIKFPDLIDDFGYEEYNLGDRIAQLVIIPYPKIKFIEVDELSNTERGEGGFGSTNK